ncbi:hypothetical protein OUZ56_017184 [Daphnia magna]|uniref:Uncharacterized protein n=1 Tax=Daphnia magna TaxID=35525 RepID=A0ABR0ASC9_9CRUS|nr:hypothetical protein OUZ56_017184 [Daphnia magna]
MPFYEGSRDATFLCFKQTISWLMYRNPTGLKTGQQPAIEQSVGKQLYKPTIQLRTYLLNLIRRVIKIATAMDVGKGAIKIEVNYHINTF